MTNYYTNVNEFMQILGNNTVPEESQAYTILQELLETVGREVLREREWDTKENNR